MIPSFARTSATTPLPGFIHMSLAFWDDAGVGINSIGVASGRRGGDNRWKQYVTLACTRYQDSGCFLLNFGGYPGMTSYIASSRF
jgi:hypothetical protein